MSDPGARLRGRLANLAVAERTRLLRLLEIEELAVGEIARVVQLPQSTVSRHLKALEEDGWLLPRREGTARLFAMRDDLDEEALALWAIVRQGTDGEHADDGLRLASVLAARELDGPRFFGQVAARWTELRRELFGTGYLVATVLALLPDDLVVADLGCGTGDALAVLAPVVGRAVGVDQEPAMLAEAARRLGGLANVELREGRLEEVPLADGEVDAALLMHVLHHVETPAAAMAEAARVARRGGRVIVLDMVPHEREEWRRTMGHVHLGFSEDDVRLHAAAAGLRLVRYTVLPPDPGVTGPPLFVATLLHLPQTNERR
jgi:SAM-dependent methyltransferase